MNLLIAGSRTIGQMEDGSYDYDKLVRDIDQSIKHNDLKPTMIISGGANGPDKAGEYWANQNGVSISVLKPNWSMGRGAGIINNKRLLEASDLLLVFYDGKSKGTADTIKRFRKEGKRVIYV